MFSSFVPFFQSALLCFIQLVYESIFTAHAANLVIFVQVRKAYTISSIHAAFEAGKLADITVCDLNLLEINPKDVLKMNVKMTIVDEKMVYEQSSNK